MASHKHHLAERSLPAMLVGQPPQFQVHCTDEGCDFQVTAATPQRAWMQVGAEFQRMADDIYIDGLEAAISRLTKGWEPDSGPVTAWPPEARRCSCGEFTGTAYEVKTGRAPHSGDPLTNPNQCEASFRCESCGRRWKVTWRPVVLEPAKMMPAIVEEAEAEVH